MGPTFLNPTPGSGNDPQEDSLFDTSVNRCAIVCIKPVVTFPPAPAAVNGRAFKGATRRGSGTRYREDHSSSETEQGRRLERALGAISQRAVSSSRKLLCGITFLCACLDIDQRRVRPELCKSLVKLPRRNTLLLTKHFTPVLADGRVFRGKLRTSRSQTIRKGGYLMTVVLPPKGRDLRLDLLRGFANWQVFINHIPNNMLNWIATENYGFSDAADLFIFISGFTALFVYARIMLERSALIAGTRIFRCAWQIYVAQVLFAPRGSDI
jgi:hypothetical protein